MPAPRPRSVALLLPCLLAACAAGPDAALRDDAPRTPIGAVQGRETRSPLAGNEVTVGGTVTAALSAGDAAGPAGWFVQDEGDGDEATSDALFVLAAPGVSLRVGDRVRVHGQVQELDTGRGSRLTALQPSLARSLGPGRADTVVLDAAPADWSRYEGMRVGIGRPLTLADSGQIASEGRPLVAFDGPLWQPAERAQPGSEAARAVAADNARRRLWLDDGRLSGAPALDSGVLPPGLAAARSGSTLDGVEGVLDARDGGWRLQLTATPVLHAAARAPAPRVGEDGDLRVAAFNLENLFNGDGHGAGFPTPRGARTAQEYALQQDKLVATIQGLRPDVAALMELENDGYGPDSTLAQLVARLNRDGGHWRYVSTCRQPCAADARGPGDDQIRVGLIYRGDRVAPRGAAASLHGGPFGNGSREPLAQAFVPQRGGRAVGPAFVVVANHFKSKGCGQAQGADRDQGDGAACWNALRTESARRLDAWLKTDPTRSGSDLTLILGDLNAYAEEDPVRLLKDAGWRDAFAVAAIERPYSYVYRGELGRLDHALLSPALAGRLRGAAEWHSNADEPESAGYRGGGAGPWRSSDHDPLVLALRLAPGR
ncbi:ExeM/NucH family extracellular endonuclease [Lysobacter silvisoli]|uniref:Endonuclease n=1 Tax=Lysobacter silvisoli TaxID=2293254 RepID=A0A371JXV7_9GAMM|nr:ExeM/NucH family extracellular endonuclease [Lysobacter silvisoli]RDZ26493.1 endonuclease [Lysobacter silvisoli]